MGGNSVTPLTSADVRRYARRKSRRRAMGVFTLWPIGLFLTVPDVFHPGESGSILEIVKPISVLRETILDVYGALARDPLVICGKVLEKSDYEFEDKVTGVCTFGYELKLNVKAAVQIARDGHTTDAADRIESDASIRSTRHVYRRTSAGEEVILLCNSVGTAVAVESEIGDAALISGLRAALAKENGNDA